MISRANRRADLQVRTRRASSPDAHPRRVMSAAGRGRPAAADVDVRPPRALRLALVACMLAVATSAFADTSTTPAKLPGNVAIAQKLNTQIPLDLQFHDEAGRVVRLNQYF